MPAKSKAQLRKLFAINPDLGRRWAHHTPDLKSLPERVADEKQASVLAKARDYFLGSPGRRAVTVGSVPAAGGLGILALVRSLQGTGQPVVPDLSTPLQGIPSIPATSPASPSLPTPPVASASRTGWILPALLGGAGGVSAAMLARHHSRKKEKTMQKKSSGVPDPLDMPRVTSGIVGASDGVNARGRESLRSAVGETTGMGTLGAAIGAPLGLAAGATRGNAPEGLGRGAIRGGAAGVGASLGGMAGSAAAANVQSPLLKALLSLGGMAGGGALGYAGAGKLMGRPSGGAKPPDRGEKEARDWLIRRQLVKAARQVVAREGRELLVRYTGKIANALPVDRQLPLRVIQTALVKQATLARAIKMAYPHLPGETRGVLASQLVRAALDHHVKEAKESGLRQVSPRSFTGPPHTATKEMGAMCD